MSSREKAGTPPQAEVTKDNRSEHRWRRYVMAAAIGATAAVLALKAQAQPRDLGETPHSASILPNGVVGINGKPQLLISTSELPPDASLVQKARQMGVNALKSRWPGTRQADLAKISGDMWLIPEYGPNNVRDPNPKNIGYVGNDEADKSGVMPAFGEKDLPFFLNISDRFMHDSDPRLQKTVNDLIKMADVIETDPYAQVSNCNHDESEVYDAMIELRKRANYLSPAKPKALGIWVEGSQVYTEPCDEPHPNNLKAQVMAAFAAGASVFSYFVAVEKDDGGYIPYQVDPQMYQAAQEVNQQLKANADVLGGVRLPSNSEHDNPLKRGVFRLSATKMVEIVVNLSDTPQSMAKYLPKIPGVGATKAKDRLSGAVVDLNGQIGDHQVMILDLQKAA